MPFDCESETACFDSVNTVTLCAYRPALESKLSSLSSVVSHANGSHAGNGHHGTTGNGTANGGSTTSLATAAAAAAAISAPVSSARVAVSVSGVCLSYGRRRTSLKPVLNSISLNVPEAAM